MTKARKGPKKEVLDIVMPTSSIKLLDSAYFFMSSEIGWGAVLNDYPLLCGRIFSANDSEMMKENAIRSIEILLSKYASYWVDNIELDSNSSLERTALYCSLVVLVPNANLSDSDKIEDLISGKRIEIECAFNNSVLSLIRVGNSLAIKALDDSGNSHRTGTEALLLCSDETDSQLLLNPFFRQLSCKVDLRHMSDNKVDVSGFFKKIKSLLYYISWDNSVSLIDSYLNCKPIKAGTRMGVDVFVCLKHENSRITANPKDDISSNEYRYDPDAKKWRSGNVVDKAKIRLDDCRYLVLEFIFKSSAPQNPYLGRGDIEPDFNTCREQILMGQVWAMTYATLNTWACEYCMRKSS
jgi:hypothetical protein